MSRESDYEQRRMENIRRNEEFLAAMDLAEEQSALRRVGAKEKRTGGGGGGGASSRKRKAELTEPTRRSSRVRGVEAEHIYVESSQGGKIVIGKGAPSDPTRQLTMLGDSSTAVKPTSSSERSRFNDQVLALGEADDEDLLARLREASASSSSAQGAADAADSSAQGLVTRFASLSCGESHKLVPERAYSVALWDQLCAVGDKEGNVGVARIGGTVESTAFRPHVGTVNVLTFGHGSLFSFSYDGTVRRMPLARPGEFLMAFATGKAESNGDDVWLQHGAVVGSDCGTAWLAFSDGTVLCRDLAADRELWSFAAHDKKVQTVSLSPDQRYLATASLDRSVKLWDLRKAQSGKSAAKSALLGTFEDANSINSCSFNAGGSKLLAVGQSQRLHLFASPQVCSGGQLKPAHSLAHDNRTGRYLAVFHAAWDPRDDDAFVCGSMLQPRRIELFNAKDKIKLVLNLAGDGLSSVCSRNAFHPTLDIVAGVNASGRLHLFGN
jgi:WD40 repeat protein